MKHFKLNAFLIFSFCLVTIASFCQTPLSSEVTKEAPVISKTVGLKNYSPETVAKIRQSVEKEHNSIAANRAMCAVLADTSPKEALVYCNKVVSLDPKDYRGLLLLGHVYNQLGENEKAITHYQQSIKVDSLNAYVPYTYSSMCLSYLMLKQSDLAIQACQHSISLNPNLAIAHCDLGVGYTQKNMQNEALPEFKKAIELDKTFVMAYVDISSIYLNRKQYDEGTSYLEKAIELDPNNALAQFNLGTLYLRKRDFPSAILHLEKALQLNPTYEPIHYQLALTYCLAQKRDKATVEYDFLNKAGNLQNIQELNTFFATYCPTNVNATQTSLAQ